MSTETAQINEVEQRCLARLPEHLRWFVQKLKVCPCSVAAIYQEYGLEASLLYIQEVSILNEH